MVWSLLPEHRVSQFQASAPTEKGGGGAKSSGACPWGGGGGGVPYRLCYCDRTSSLASSLQPHPIFEPDLFVCQLQGGAVCREVGQVHNGQLSRPQPPLL